MIRSLAVFLGVLAVLPSAEARTRADCNKIDNPMEFNRCLASLAPEKSRRVARGRMVPDEEADAPRRQRIIKRPQPENPVKQVSGGRKRIEFPVR